MSHFVEIRKVQTNANSARNFSDACEILINKPHVINRRLCGKNILCRQQCVGPLPAAAQDVEAVMNRGRTLWKQCDSHPPERFLNVLLSEQTSAEFPPTQKRFKSDCSGETNHRDDPSNEIILRELLPKRRDLYSKQVELVLLNVADQRITFIPLINRPSASGDAASQSSDLAFCLKLTDSWLIVEALEEDHQSTSSDLSSCLAESAAEDIKTLGFSKEFLHDKLTPQVAGWLMEKRLDTREKSLTQISVEKYNEVYHSLKTKYGVDLVKNWPMTTDPQKFVFEDISIASYLLVLWEEERKCLGTETKQRFLDLGCGNGLLVHLLASEGHPGRGIDIRKRDIWDMYGEGTTLEEMAITPSDSHLFPECDWLIGNHSDELTPWIPVIAARSSYQCRFFVLPCCTWDFNRKFADKVHGSSLYTTYLNFIEKLSVDCGFCVKTDTLRIPSTKKACIIGYKRNHPEEEHDEVDRKLKAIIDSRCSGATSADNKEKKHSDSSLTQPKVSQCTCGSKNSFDVTSNEFCERCATLRRMKSADTESWVSDFKARDESDTPRNYSNIDLGVKDFVIKTVTDSLLSTTNTKQLEDGRTWNKGGRISLKDVAGMFDQDVLSHMKSGCGGVQTLLKNSHHIFRVQDGHVQLRDWTTDDEAHFLAKRKKKGKKPQNMAKFLKTKLCWFDAQHPDGCPKSQSSCPFAHSAEELKTREPQTFQDDTTPTHS